MRTAVALILAALALTGCARDLFTERQSDSGLSQILRTYGPK